MRIAILSRNPKLYSTRRLREAAIARGHDAKVLDTLKFSIFVEEEQPELYFRTKRLRRYDAVIPRIGASITFFGAAVVRQFEQMGVFVLNASTAINTSRDKLRTMQILSRHEIGMPDTAFAKDRADILPAIERVGGAPVIIKLLIGTQGRGVILAESIKMAEAVIDTLHGAKQNVLIQKFVAESKGTDIRALVVGDRVVAAMRRRAQGTEFRSNVHLGGTTEGVTLDQDFERTAVHAAQILGLRVAGVDMLEGENGPQVMEVNSSPGLEGIERATGVDVAGAIVEHLEDQIKFPDLDLHHRLSLGRGYSIAEFEVAAESELAGMKLRDTELRERDVLVLSIDRGGVTLPNPHGGQEIMVGDVLLCYGKKLVLSTLIPIEQRKRARKKKKKNRKSKKTARRA
jgi:ribosomal protein S6--L-glutamate ligase